MKSKPLISLPKKTPEPIYANCESDVIVGEPYLLTPAKRREGLGTNMFLEMVQAYDPDFFDRLNKLIPLERLDELVNETLQFIRSNLNGDDTLIVFILVEALQRRGLNETEREYLVEILSNP